ncbi:MAG: hypothetical protein CVU50_06120 [Candidatus Cloacimonetes bacterium HGW-Cloacimonetes-3]|nr:MAG: hypothetical protein CVU50_06120 [Candidatus Cloacimonetes bacterium HGW-Cloacimonetes-3]
MAVEDVCYAFPTRTQEFQSILNSCVAFLFTPLILLIFLYTSQLIHL